MKTVQLESEVGVDGILSLQIPFGAEESQKRVLVTIQPLTAEPTNDANVLDWDTFVAETYGSCEGLSAEEPEDLPVEHRLFHSAKRNGSRVTS